LEKLQPFIQLEASFTDDHQLFMVMPLIIRGSLEDRLSSGISTGDSLRVFAQIATGLDFMHKVSKKFRLQKQNLILFYFRSDSSIETSGLAMS
jgi:serine/threonine protein kinase